jgi:hypothetical protein
MGDATAAGTKPLRASEFSECFLQSGFMERFFFRHSHILLSRPENILHPFVYENTAAPGGAPPRRINNRIKITTYRLTPERP